jgi:hypothetical protein
MLSSVELNERVRSLGAVKRLGYSTVVAIVIVAAFWFAIMLSIVVGLFLAQLLIGSPLTLPEDAISLGLPLSLIFMLTVGMSGLGSQHTLIPGQELKSSARRVARSGFVVGVVCGAIFGFFWALLIGADPLLFAVIVGLSLAPALAGFRAVTHIIEPACLRLMAR